MRSQKYVFPRICILKNMRSQEYVFLRICVSKKKQKEALRPPLTLVLKQMQSF